MTSDVVVLLESVVTVVESATPASAVSQTVVTQVIESDGTVTQVVESAATPEPQVVESAQQGPPGPPSPQLSKTLTYDGSGRLGTITDALGVKTFGYVSGRLDSITATGSHKSKSFGYDGSGRLTSITVAP